MANPLLPIDFLIPFQVGLNAVAEYAFQLFVEQRNAIGALALFAAFLTMNSVW